MVDRVCECGIYVRPASECPTGRCEKTGRVVSGPTPRDPNAPRSPTLPAIETDSGNRWVSEAGVPERTSLK